eukprot:m.160706 g.160706  ORF g.160706 m.160706 type:complete len:257 (+) comp38779_c0_seq1:37-807(+)
MGNDASKSPQSRLCALFKGQKVLLIGQVGVGKTSLLNTVAYVATGTLAEKKDAQAKGTSTTKELKRYDIRQTGTTLPALTFLDTCGMPPGDRGYVRLYSGLVQGLYRSKVDLNQVIQEWDPEKDPDPPLPKNETEEERKKHTPDVLLIVFDVNVVVSTAFLEEVKNGVAESGRESDLKVYIIATKDDERRKKDSAEELKNDFLDSISKVYGKSKTPFFISNYVPAGFAGHGSSFIDRDGCPLEKQEAIVEIFTKVL